MCACGVMKSVRSELVGLAVLKALRPFVSRPVCYCGEHDPKLVARSAAWEVGHFPYKNISPHHATGLISVLSYRLGSGHQCSVSTDSALGFLGVPEPHGTALGLRIPLLLHCVPP